MLFSSHVAAGFLLGSVGRRPAGFAAGVLSHLVMDFVPHWGTADRERFLRVARADGLFALVLSSFLLVRRPAAAATLFGAALPDLEKPVRHLLGRRLFPPRVASALAVLQDESEDRLFGELLAGVCLVASAVAVARRGR